MFSTKILVIGLVAIEVTLAYRALRREPKIKEFMDNQAQKVKDYKDNIVNCYKEGRGATV